MNQKSMDAIAAKIHDLEPSTESVTFNEDGQIMWIRVVLGVWSQPRCVMRNGVELFVIDGGRA